VTTAPTPALADAQVFRTYYFVPGYERDPAKMHAFDLGQLLTGAAQELKSNAKPVDLQVAYPPGSVRLTEVKPQPRGNVEVGLEVRTLHDSYMLTTIAQQPGPVAPGSGPPIVPPVDPHVPQNFTGQALDKFLGKFTIYTAEVPAGTHPTEMEEAARAYARRHWPSANPTPASTAQAAILIDLNIPKPGARDALEPRCVVIYPTGTDILHFLRIALPELFLYHLKARVLYQDVRSHSLDALRDDDEKIRALLAETRDSSRLGPDELLAANDTLTTLLTTLVADVSATENQVHTGEIARKNFNRAAAECQFAPAALAVLTRVLMDDWVSMLNDLADAALGYRRRTRDLARVHFESLQATVEMHQARETRYLAIVMAVLTCAQVGGVILSAFGDNAWEEILGKEFPVWGAVAIRIALAVVCTLGFFAIGWAVWLRRARPAQAQKYHKP
jgi:hypothetical protein